MQFLTFVAYTLASISIKICIREKLGKQIMFDNIHNAVQCVLLKSGWLMLVGMHQTDTFISHAAHTELHYF